MTEREMPQDILNPDFWRKRLEGAAHRHCAIFNTHPDIWERIEDRHREVLAEKIGPTDKILDFGCAWGRLLDMLPETYQGYYLGIDISPDFLELARVEHPEETFIIGDLREVLPSLPDDRFDWAIGISMRPMITRNLGEDGWDEIEAELKRVSRYLLLLEYQEHSDSDVFIGTRKSRTRTGAR